MSHSQESSAEVEHEAEGRRADLAHTLEQLRENLKPENVVEEVMTNAKFGAGNLVDGLWQTARRHPLSALLIGAGLALLLGVGTRRNGRVARSDEGSGASLPPTGRTTVTPSRLVAPLDAPRPAADRLAPGAADREGSAMPSEPRAGDAERFSVRRILDERPLVVGAVGLAVGATIGAVLPISRIEEDWLGDSSAAMKRSAQDAAEAQLAELKSAADRAVDHVKQSATRHGLSAENFNGLVREVGGHAKAAMQDIGDNFETSRRPTPGDTP